MKFLVIAAALFATVYAQRRQEEIYNPIPYSFNYVAEGDEGRSGHQESGDGAGNVQGSYMLADADGRNRVVEYVAGPDGFRATVRTNEPGTDNSAPADVIFESTAADAKGPVITYSNAAQPASRVVSTGGAQRQNVRYVLVPSTDPRARGQL